MSELFYKIKLFEDFIEGKDKSISDVLSQDCYSNYVLNKAYDYSGLIQTLWANELVNKKSKPYLEFGVLKRFILILSYFENIIRIAPAKRVEPLDYEEIVQFNSNLNALIISLTGLVDCTMWVLAYESPSAEVEIDGKKHSCPASLEENKNLVRLDKRFMNILKIKKNFSDKILSYSEWYRKLSNKRNFVAHGVPFGICNPIFGPEVKALKANYDKKIKKALIAKDHTSFRSLQIESLKLGVFNPNYMGFTGKKLVTYKLYETLPEHIAKTINLSVLILNTALLDSRITNAVNEA